MLQDFEFRVLRESVCNGRGQLMVWSRYVGATNKDQKKMILRKRKLARDNKRKKQQTRKEGGVKKLFRLPCTLRKKSVPQDSAGSAADLESETSFSSSSVGLLPFFSSLLQLSSQSGRKLVCFT